MAFRDLTSLRSQVEDAATLELDRLRAEYADRDRRLAQDDVYSLFNQGWLYTTQRRQRAVLKLLSRERFYPLHDKEILEIGCGSGAILREFQWFGAAPCRLHGIDLLDHCIESARRASPHFSLATADAQDLPFPDDRFDLVTQFTVFSSILEDGIKRAAAAEMLRVVRPHGLILWYDFWLNPTNSKTRGIRPHEIRSLFPSCGFSFQRLTLAPPIARFLAPYSWSACRTLERLRLLSSHYLVAIRPRTGAYFPGGKES